MSKMRVVVLAGSIGAAVVAAMLAKGVIGKKAAAPAPQIISKVETTDVLVAARDIQTGEKLASGSLIWKAWPKDNVLDPMITKEEMPDAEEKYAEARAFVPMFEGEVINDKKIVKPGDGGFISAILPKGMRAISTRIREETGVGRLILPNDRVDVLYSLKGRTTVTTETLFHNVRVLAIGQLIEARDGKRLAEGNTATLELTPDQAEQLAQAVQRGGEISFALRSIADIEPDGPRGKTAAKEAERRPLVRWLKYGRPSSERVN